MCKFKINKLTYLNSQCKRPINLTKKDRSIRSIDPSLIFVKTPLVIYDILIFLNLRLLPQNAILVGMRQHTPVYLSFFLNKADLYIFLIKITDKQSNIFKLLIAYFQG